VVTPTGLARKDVSPYEIKHLRELPPGGGAKSGANPAGPAAEANLRPLAATWNALPDAVKAGIVAMVKASTGP
jgi:hypothetical protein